MVLAVAVVALASPFRSAAFTLTKAAPLVEHWAGPLAFVPVASPFVPGTHWVVAARLVAVVTVASVVARVLLTPLIPTLKRLPVESYAITPDAVGAAPPLTGTFSEEVKVLAPLKLLAPFSRGTLAESRASARVPLDTLVAFKLVSPAPLPVKELLALLNVSAFPYVPAVRPLAMPFV